MPPQPRDRAFSANAPRGDDTNPGTAVLVAVQLPGVTDEQHAADLAELRRLVTTLGHRTVGTVSQRRQFPSRAAVLGSGKLTELAAYTGGSGVVPSAAPEVKNKVRARQAAESEGAEDAELEDLDEAASPVVPPAELADVVVVDHEITPRQARNLERATGAVVLDRTGVIVEIFHRHARSREARLEVEIARLSYVAPRLREAGAGRDKQRGGGVKRGAPQDPRPPRRAARGAGRGAA
jgi:GTPase